MIDINYLAVAVGIAAGISGVIFGYIKMRQVQESSSKERGKESATLYSDIGYIKSGIDDLKRKQEKADERYIELAMRVTSVEESAKQAHKRIDCIDQK